MERVWKGKSIGEDCFGKEMCIKIRKSLFKNQFSMILNAIESKEIKGKNVISK